MYGSIMQQNPRFYFRPRRYDACYAEFKQAIARVERQRQFNQIDELCNIFTQESHTVASQEASPKVNVVVPSYLQKRVES
jgi:hypothetical protein